MAELSPIWKSQFSGAGWTVQMRIPPRGPLRVWFRAPAFYACLLGKGGQHSGSHCFPAVPAMLFKSWSFYRSPLPDMGCKANINGNYSGISSGHSSGDSVRPQIRSQVLRALVQWSKAKCCPRHCLQMTCPSSRSSNRRSHLEWQQWWISCKIFRIPPLYSLRESSVTGTIEIETIQRRSAKDDTHKSRSEHRSPPTVTAQVKGIKVNDVENQPCYRGWRFIFIVPIHKNSQIGAPATVGDCFTRISF